MKKKLTFVGIIIIVLGCLVLSGCQTEEAKMADSKIWELNGETISLYSWSELKEVDDLISNLSDREIRSLENYKLYEEKLAEYKALEDAAVEDLEKMIKDLPSVKEMKLADRETVENVSDAYSRAVEPVKARVSNHDILEKAEAKMEKIKEDCWVSCSSCGGDGKTSCGLCGGSGMRWVNHTTPNGKTWRVTQECATTRSCGACAGQGGIYVEK